MNSQKQNSTRRHEDTKKENKGLVFLRAFVSWCWICFLFLTPAPANPVWKAPDHANFGELAVLELREDDPSAPTLPRPPLEDRVGPFRVRAMEPTLDGHGWRVTVQALSPGIALFPAMDLGDGRRTAPLRLPVTRTTPYGGLWMAIGGGPSNALPEIPFPWGWASLLLLPPLLLGTWLVRRWLGAAPKRLRKRLAKRFAKAWPPAEARASLDQAHALGRELLATARGEEALGWGPEDLKARHLEAWAKWSETLDQARFGGRHGGFPSAQTLLAALDRTEHGDGP